jgi:hypothetical protein
MGKSLDKADARTLRATQLEEAVLEAASGAAGPADPDAQRKPARTLAQTFCLVTGIVLVVVGVIGFFVNSTFTAGPGVSGEELILFEVNGWHNVVHLAKGAFLVVMAASARTAITGALAFGVLYVVVTIYGFIDGDDFLTIPINLADNFLHLALALLAIAVGLSAGGLGGAAARDRTAWKAWFRSRRAGPRA